MSGKSFSFSEVLGFGWHTMKSNFLFFAAVIIIAPLISLLGQIAEQIMAIIVPFLFFVMLAVSSIIQIILKIGLTKIALRFCDSQKPKFSTLFNGLDCFLRYLGTALLFSLIIGGASIACILPLALLTGVLHNPFFALPFFAVLSILLVALLIKYSLCFYFVVDKGLGPIKALKASSRATEGARWLLFVFFILCGLINLLGILCFLVGLFATVPTIMVATALVYRELSKQTPELAELGISIPGIAPGGGIRPLAGMQPNPIIPSIQSIQSGPSIRPSGGVQPAATVRPSSAVRPIPNVQPSQGTPTKATPSATAGPAPSIRREGENKSNSSAIFWFAALIILSFTFVAGIGYRLWSRSKSKANVSSKDATVSPKDAAVFLKDAIISLKKVELKGILYSEDNPSALIGSTIAREGDVIEGVKVVKINKDTVEFEKDGERWTQRTK